MKKPPRPTGTKAENPPILNAPDNPSFSYEPKEKEPTLDDTHPRLAGVLHIVVMSFIYAAAFFLATAYLFLRGGWSNTPLLLISSLIGGGYAVYKICKLTSPN